MKCFAAISLLFGIGAQAAQQLVPNIVTANAAPDAVATSLMPVPIFNFAVHNVAFSPDGTILATGDGTGTVRLWNTRTGELKAAVQAHTNWAFSVAWAPDGKFLYVGLALSSRTSHGKTLAIPIPPGEAFPKLPASGISRQEDGSGFPGSRVIDGWSISPGPDPSVFAYVKTTVHRNLFRIPLPPQ